MSAAVQDPARQLMVQMGSTARVELVFTTSPVQSGKANAVSVAEAFLFDMNGTTVLSDDVFTQFVELAAPTGTSTPVTATPSFSDGGGPTGQDIYIITVQDSSSFAVNDYVRAAEQEEGAGTGGMVYKVLAIPDGTHIRVHANQGEFDIINGDTLEEVLPSGIYVAYYDFVVDDSLSISDPRAHLRVSFVCNATGDGPTFAAADVLPFVRTFELDFNGLTARSG